MNTEQQTPHLAPHLTPHLATYICDLFQTPPRARAVVEALAAAEAAGHTGLLVDADQGAEVVVAGLATRIIHDPGSDVSVDRAVPTTPLIWDGQWLGTRRVWAHDQGLAKILVERARQCLPPLTTGMIADLDRLFPVSAQALSEGGVDWQRQAAQVALTRGLAVITGGPGCGKTTVAGRIVEMIVQERRRHGQVMPTVILAAPTGKAAARLGEAVAQPRDVVGAPSTLHGLFHDVRIATADMLIIDELSMADAATLHRVLTRVRPQAHVLLLGDPDQLASVQAGRVLGDVAVLAPVTKPASSTSPATTSAQTNPSPGPLTQAQVRLRVNWRSGQAPALAALVKAMQDGATDLRGFFGPSGSAVTRCDVPASPGALVATLCSEHAAWCQQCLGDDRDAALGGLEACRLLTVLRQGPWGSQGLNAVFEQELLRRYPRPRDRDGHFLGRLVLFTRNRPDLDVRNGDVGVIVDGLSTTSGVIGASWALYRGRDLPLIPLHRLENLEPAWFLTVHKAQGSQANHVDIIGLPSDASVGQRALATREMAYTAITRSARTVRLWWQEDGLAAALDNREQQRRHSNMLTHLRRYGG